MTNSEVLIPVRCRQCGAAGQALYPIIVVVTALTRWHQMRLYSPCHPVAWDATAGELQSIYDHLGAPWVEFHRIALASGSRRNSRQAADSRSTPRPPDDDHRPEGGE